jgi:hypothetical protein
VCASRARLFAETDEFVSRQLRKPSVVYAIPLYKWLKLRAL